MSFTTNMLAKLWNTFHDMKIENNQQDFKDSMILIRGIVAVFMMIVFIITLIYLKICSIFGLDCNDNSWNLVLDVGVKSQTGLYFMEFVICRYFDMFLCDSRMPNSVCKARVMGRCKLDTKNNPCGVCLENDTVFHCCRCSMAICSVCYGGMIRRNQRQTCPQCRIQLKRHYVKLVKD